LPLKLSEPALPRLVGSPEVDAPLQAPRAVAAKKKRPGISS
jgi:hypothetical protein